MKVLMIEHFSAGNRYTVELCESLAEHVNLTMLTVDNSPIEDGKKYNCKKVLCGHGYPFLKRIRKYLKSLMYTVKEVINREYDAVHIQTFRVPFVEIFLYLILKPVTKKIIYTAHNILPHETNYVDKILYKLMYMISDKIVVHNNHCKNLLMQDFKVNEKKIFVIPHGIYDSYKESDLQAKKDSLENKDKLVILQIGTIREYKGIKTLIEAIYLLPDGLKERVRVIIAGSQALKLDSTNYEKLIDERNLQNIITLINRRISDEEMGSFYNGADISVLPYKEIYGSGALLMSYTYNKPVLVSNVPAFLEETDMGKTGLIFEKENANDLKEKIIEFLELEEDKKNTMKKNITNLINQKYNWKVSAKLTYDVYSGNFYK